MSAGRSPRLPARPRISGAFLFFRGGPRKKSKAGEQSEIRETGRREPFKFSYEKLDFVSNWTRSDATACRRARSNSMVVSSLPHRRGDQAEVGVPNRIVADHPSACRVRGVRKFSSQSQVNARKSVEATEEHGCTVEIHPSTGSNFEFGPVVGHQAENGSEKFSTENLVLRLFLENQHSNNQAVDIQSTAAADNDSANFVGNFVVDIQSNLAKNKSRFARDSGFLRLHSAHRSAQADGIPFVARFAPQFFRSFTHISL